MNRRPMNPTMLETEKRPHSVRETIKLMNAEPLPNGLFQTKEEYIKKITDFIHCPVSESTLRYQIIDFATVFYHCEIGPFTALEYIQTYVDKVIKHRGLT